MDVVLSYYIDRVLRSGKSILTEGTSFVGDIYSSLITLTMFTSAKIIRELWI